MSPTTSSKANKTAASGVLKAAAIAAAAPTGTSAFTFSCAIQLAAQHGCNARSHLHGRTFAAEWNSAGKCRGCTEELSKDRAQGNSPAARIQGGFRLWNTTAASIRKVAEQQITHSQRASHWNQQPPPSCAARGYSRAPNRSVSRMKATTTAPTQCPINRVRTRKTVPRVLAKEESTVAPVLSPVTPGCSSLPSSLAILRALAYLTDDTTIRRPGCDSQHSSRFCVATIGKFEDSYEGLDCESLH